MLRFSFHMEHYDYCSDAIRFAQRYEGVKITGNRDNHLIVVFPSTKGIVEFLKLLPKDMGCDKWLSISIKRPLLVQQDAYKLQARKGGDTACPLRCLKHFVCKVTANHTQMKMKHHDEYTIDEIISTLNILLVRF